MAALACSTAPAFADNEYSTDDVAPSWTAASAESCADPDVAPLLTSFDDEDFYAPAPGGAFENGAAGWQLDGGASIGAADGGLNVLGMSHNALALPVGAAATSPTFCVDERYPHFRFSFAQESLDDDADVRVEVVYPGLLGEERPQGQGPQGQARARLAAQRQDQARTRPWPQARRVAAGRDPHPREGRQAEHARARRRRGRRPARARLIAPAARTARPSGCVAGTLAPPTMLRVSGTVSHRRLPRSRAGVSRASRAR